MTDVGPRLHRHPLAVVNGTPITLKVPNTTMESPSFHPPLLPPQQPPWGGTPVKGSLPASCSPVLDHLFGLSAATLPEADDPPSSDLLDEVRSPTSTSHSRLSATSSLADYSNVRVCLRIRPFVKRELEEGPSTSPAVTVSHDGTVATVVDPKTKKEDSFRFDSCLWSVNNTPDASCSGDVPISDQTEVYAHVGVPLLESLLGGFNTCILSYGQTGSGKTYTMIGDLGSAATQGLTPRLCEELFRQVAQAGSGTVFRVEASFLEIYNEKVRDLLAPADCQKELAVRQHPILGPFVQGLSSTVVHDAQCVLALLRRGEKERAKAATKMNERSSRSHVIFTLAVARKTFVPAGDPASEEVMSTRTSKLSLVDLAGSERCSKTGVAGGVRFEEMTCINLSLTTLARVIDALVEGPRRTGLTPTCPSPTPAARGQRRSRLCIPYRESTLTWILSDSLGGNSQTVMLATVSPAATNYSETLSTLRYASRARKVQNRAVINEDPSARVIRQLQQEVEALRLELAEAVERNAALSGRDTAAEVQFLRSKMSIGQKLMDEMGSRLAAQEKEWSLRAKESQLCIAVETPRRVELEAACERLKEELQQCRMDLDSKSTELMDLHQQVLSMAQRLRERTADSLALERQVAEQEEALRQHRNHCGAERTEWERALRAEVAAEAAERRAALEAREAAAERRAAEAQAVERALQAELAMVRAELQAECAARQSVQLAADAELQRLRAELRSATQEAAVWQRATVVAEEAAARLAVCASEREAREGLECGPLPSVLTVDAPQLRGKEVRFKEPDGEAKEAIAPAKNTKMQRLRDGVERAKEQAAALEEQLVKDDSGFLERLMRDRDHRDLANASKALEIRSLATECDELRKANAALEAALQECRTEAEQEVRELRAQAQKEAVYWRQRSVTSAAKCMRRCEEQLAEQQAKADEREAELQDELMLLRQEAQDLRAQLQREDKGSHLLVGLNHLLIRERTHQRVVAEAGASDPLSPRASAGLAAEVVKADRVAREHKLLCLLQVLHQLGEFQTQSLEDLAQHRQRAEQLVGMARQSDGAADHWAQRDELQDPLLPLVVEEFNRQMVQYVTSSELFERLQKGVTDHVADLLHSSLSPVTWPLQRWLPGVRPKPDIGTFNVALLRNVAMLRLEGEVLKSNFLALSVKLRDLHQENTRLLAERTDLRQALAVLEGTYIRSLQGARREPVVGSPRPPNEPPADP